MIRHKRNVSFPAIFYENGDRWAVVFPDLKRGSEALEVQASNLAEAKYEAVRMLAFQAIYMWDGLGEEMPEPSDINSIEGDSAKGRYTIKTVNVSPDAYWAAWDDFYASFGDGAGEVVD